MYRFTLNPNKLKLKLLQFIRAKSKFKPALLECAMYLDTETSHNHNEDTPIGWLESICFEFNNEIVIVRKPSDFIQILNSIKSYYELDITKKLVIYVHNLSYDFQFIKDWLIQEYGVEYTTIAVSSHKVISFMIDCFIFKCSYRLANKSLAKWGKDLNVLHKKLEDSVDYDKINYQDDTLTYTELKYQYYDVLCLKECVIKQMDLYNDNLQTIPLTATAYIRREMLTNYKKNRHENRKLFDKWKMNVDEYKQNRVCFGGGYTHGNRFYKAQTIDLSQTNSIIKHRDFTSHYPSCLRVNKFPVGKWLLLYNEQDNVTIETVLNNTDEYCLLTKLVVSNLKIKRGITFPYAQYSKLYQGQINHCRFTCDNGRVLEMKGQSEIVLTEMDLKLFKSQYTFDYTIVSVLASAKDYLPQYIIETIDTFFKGKTHYKEIVHELKKQGYTDYNPKMLEATLDLMKSKNGLNAVYGCMATDIVRLEWSMDLVGEWEREIVSDLLIQAKLDKFNKNPNSTLSYSFGVYCTSYARAELFQYIETIGYENVIYVDTDSAFYISNSDIEKRIDVLNSEKRKHAEDIKAYIVTDKGSKVYYDYFDDEEERIQKFRFLHSKCYCYIEENGNEHLTVAGVSALSKDKSINRMQELGNIDNLAKGFVFTKCGGTISKYIEARPHTEVINGHITEVASSCIITDNTKTLNDIWEEVDIEYVEDWEVEDL